MSLTKASSMAIDTWLHNIPRKVICEGREWEERCPVNGEWGDISLGDQFKALCTLGKRKNDRTGQWEYQFILEAMEPADGHRKAKQDGYTPKEAEEVDLPF